MTITLDGTTGITTPTTSTTGEFVTSVTSFKNRIINGAMVIDQRNAGASVNVTNNLYTLDRWVFDSSQTGKLTCQQNAASVTPPAGFANYLGITSATSYSVLTSDTFTLKQNIEGFNTADLGFGAAGASTVALSFWVRSSLTGTFGASLVNSAFNRSYPFSYTISSANTWEYKTVTVAGDTSGTWVGATNGIGLRVYFNLGAGSTYVGTANTWNAGGYVSPSGATSVVGTSGATFYITGVQLEKGSTATSFDYRSYGTELQLCQRYLCAFGSIGSTGTNGDVFIGSQRNTSQAWFAVQYPVPMRSTPSLTSVSTSGAQWSTASNDNAVTSWNVSNTPTPRTAFMYGGGSFNSGQTAGLMYTNGSTTTNAFYFSAEL